MAGQPALASETRLLEREAGVIDAAFATVGEKLSQALAIFDPTIEGLSAISARFLGEEMTSAAATLDGVVRELQALAVLLPADVQSLKAIEELGKRAGQSFTRLLNDTRMITAVTRSARIEAARLSTDAWQGVGFFDQIGEQAIPAIETIKLCAADHTEVTKCLMEASVSLKRYATDYAPALASLATRLKVMVPQVEAYRRESLDATQAASRQSRKLTEVLGEAIVALQGGDSTRQRIEHAVAGLHLLENLASDAAARPSSLSAEGTLALDQAIRRIVSTQLGATADRMARDSGGVDRALQSVAAEVEATVELSRTLAQRETAGDAVSLSRFEAELRRSSELIAACRVALNDLDRVTKVSTGAILKFRDAAADLSRTVSTIVLIGMNASLNSSRLGSQGRVLAVIAHEIKAVADSISVGTEQLLPTFNEMQVGARRMDEQGSNRLEQLGALDAVTERLLTTMRDSRSRMGIVLQALAQDSDLSAGVIRQALTRLSPLGDTVAAMRRTAELLNDGAEKPAIGNGDGPSIAAFLNATLLPVYTMEEERRLHHQVLHDLGMISNLPNAPDITFSAPSDDAFEDFLL